MGDFSDLSTALPTALVPLPLLLSLAACGLLAVLAFSPQGGSDDDDSGSGGGGLLQPAYATVRSTPTGR